MWVAGQNLGECKREGGEPKHSSQFLGARLVAHVRQLGWGWVEEGAEVREGAGRGLERTSHVFKVMFTSHTSPVSFRF